MNGEDVVLTIAGLDINGETIGTILNDMHRGYYNRYTDEYLKHSDEFKELLDTVHTWVPEKEAFVKTFYDESMDKEYHEAMDELNENQPRLYNIKRDILDNGFDMNYQGEEYKLSDTYTVDIEHVKGSDKFTVDVTGYGDDGKYHEYVSVITESEMLEMDYQSLMVRIGEIMNGYDAEAERELQEA